MDEVGGTPEQPLRFFTELGKTVLRVVRDEREDHEGHMHIPPRRTAPLQAVPFANERIPDVHLVGIIERMENDSCSLQEAAAAWGYPVSLVERAMADFQPAWRQFLQRRELGLSR